MNWTSSARNRGMHASRGFRTPARAGHGHIFESDVPPAVFRAGASFSYPQRSTTFVGDFPDLSGISSGISSDVAMLQNPTLALPSKQASSSSATFSSRDNRSHDAIHLDSAESDSILFINNGTVCSGLCGEDDEGPFSGMPALNRTLSDDPSQEFWRVLSASLHTLSPGVSQHIADDVGVSVKSLLGMHSSLYGPAGTGTLSPIRLSQNDVLLSLHRILRACRAGLLRVGGDGDGDVDLDNLIDALERAGKQQAATVRDKSLLFPSASLPPPLPPRSAHAHAHVPVPVPVPELELELEHESGLHEQGGEMASPLAFGLLHSSRTHTHSMCVDAGRPQLFSSASASASASASSTSANLKQPFSFASIVSPLSSLPSKARSIRSGPGAEAGAEAGAEVDPVLSLCLDHNDGDGEGEGEGEGEGMDTSSGSGGDCLSFTDVSNDAFAFAIHQQQQYQHQHQHQQQQQQHHQSSRTPLSLPPTKKHCTYSDRE